MNNINDTIGKVDLTALKRSFIDSLSNKEFKDYVDSLKIDYDILMKYTSSLEDSFCEQKKCLKCKSLTMCKNDVAGYKYSPIYDGKVVNFSYVMCPYKKQNIERLSYQNNLEMFEMPKELNEASFKNLYVDNKKRIPVIKYFKEFMENYNEDNDSIKGLYLNGSFGVGKTYLVAALFNEMAKKGVHSILVYYPELLRSLKSSFQNNSEFRSRFDSIKKAPLLLLDDIGAENNWKFSWQLLIQGLTK